MSFGRTAYATESMPMPALAPSPKYPNVKLIPRLSHERGHADHNWLKTFHTFSFASYYEPLYAGFGSLRVINEDRVAPSRGFGRHPHSEMEIFSYIVSGELEHKDSMGNVEVMRRGDVQMTSAGTGISHSESNPSPSTGTPVHFLQIWIIPSLSRLTPKYYTRHFSDSDKLDKLVRIVGSLPGFSSKSGRDGEVEDDEVVDEREASGPTPAPVHAPVNVYASILSPSSSVSHSFAIGEQPKEGPGETMPMRKGYIHLIQTSGYNTGPSSSNGARIRINGGLELGEGDGAFVMVGGGNGDGGVLEVENVGRGRAEFLVFDME